MATKLELKTEALNLIVTITKNLVALDDNRVDMHVYDPQFVTERRHCGCAMHHFMDQTDRLFDVLEELQHDLQFSDPVDRLFAMGHDYPEPKGEPAKLEFCRRALPLIKMIREL